ncbi:MAG: hypothetical protein ACTSU5_13060 [Promethearchaeota archaeon]
MPRGIVIIAWRNDVGAYLLDSYPENIEVDGQDLMQIYNMHRFRATDPNFQFVKIGTDLNCASFYSGGYKSNFIGKPNYCVTLLLEKDESAIKFERVLVKITNNLLRHLNDEDFEEYIRDVFEKVKSGDFDAITIERGDGEVIPELDEDESQEISEERQIFEDLVAAAEEISEGDSDAAAAFDRAGGSDPFSAEADPFGGTADPFAATPGGSGASPSADPFTADPFSTGADPFAATPGGSGASPSADPFTADPFSTAEPPTPSAPAPMMKSTGPSTPQLMRDLKILDMKKPKEPAGGSPTDSQRVDYLEKLVGWFEQKLSLLSKIAKKLQDKEQEVQEKDDLIGKLMLLIS